ncbi:hypothetical protein M9434_006087 [Picochlorum sp. BPE23]|nr:hypothetical protein M9434_006087 [Picochlorum sp. BPE23]
MQIQGHISVPERAVRSLFGSLGTHSQFGSGGVLWLQDKFFSDHLGRKIIVMGPNRQAAADSMKAFLEDLTGVEPTDKSAWRYVDPKKKIHGPYRHGKMLAWYHKGYFESKMAMLYENPVIRVWVPVWILEYVEHSDSTGVPGQRGVDGMEWEATVQDVAELRTSYVEVVQKHDDGSVGGTEAVRGGFGGGVAPMDYDAVEVAWDDGTVMHLVAVLDTNVLLSHFSFLERTFQEMLSSSYELMVIVPWVVLNELDHLKEGRNREAAMYAIKRINTLNSQRDSFLFIQSAKSHTTAVNTVSLPDQRQSLRNDDFIMQTCMYFEQTLVQNMRKKGHKACITLVSNDQGLQMRATANGLNCIKAVEFATNGKKLVEKIEVEHSISMPGESAVTNKSDTGVHEMEQLLSRVVDTKHVEEPRSSVVVQAVQSPPHVLSMHDLHMLIIDAIAHGLGTVVMYFRQQDLGDMWEELLEDELKPPWEAPQVLKVMIRHSTTFWHIFDRNLTQDAKVLLRYLHFRAFEAHAHDCVLIVMRLLHASQAAFSKPFDGEAPDPATVPNFVSLGQAKKAIEDSISSINSFIHAL